MDIAGIRQVFEEKIKPYGEALEVIYAQGGLMAHHDGVNSAVTAFWDAAAQHVRKKDQPKISREEFDDMYGSLVHLTINANTRVEDIVGSRAHAKVLNGFDAY